MPEHFFSFPTESVTDMFSCFGAVKVVRICTKDSKGRLPTWLTLGCMNPNSHHAYVEFNEEHEAVKAAQAISLPLPCRDQDTRIRVHRLTDRLEYLLNNPQPIVSPSPSPSPSPLATATLGRWNSSGGLGSTRASRESSPNARWGNLAASSDVAAIMPRSSVDHVAPVQTKKIIISLPPHPSVESQRWHRRTSPLVPLAGSSSLGMEEGGPQPRVIGLTHGGVLTTQGEGLLSMTSSRVEERPSWGSDRSSLRKVDQQEAYVPPSRRSRDSSPSPPPPVLSPLPQQFTLESLAASITATGSPYSPVTAFHAFMSPSPPPPEDPNGQETSRVALSAMISDVMAAADGKVSGLKAQSFQPQSSDLRRLSHRGDGASSDDLLASQASDLIGRLLIGIPHVSSNSAAMKPPLSRKTMDDAGLPPRDMNRGRRSVGCGLKPAPGSYEEVIMISSREGSERERQMTSSRSLLTTSSDQLSRNSSILGSEGSGNFASEGGGADEDDEYGAGGIGEGKKKRTRRRRSRKTADLVNVPADPTAVSMASVARRMTTGWVAPGADRAAPLVTLPPTFPGVAKKDYVAPTYVVSKGPDGTTGFAGGRERSRTVS